MSRLTRRAPALPASGQGTKIDNLVHIGHNVTVGKNCVIVAQVGVSGSVEIGDGVILAGQVGIKDHVTIGDGTIVAAKTGVIGDLPAQGVCFRRVWPPAWQRDARPGRLFSKLPELYKQIKDLEARLGRDGDRRKRSSVSDRATARDPGRSQR